MPKNYFEILEDSTNATILRSNAKFTFHVWKRSTSAFHSHDNYIEVFIVNKGEIISKTKNDEILMRAGDAGIILPHEPHMQYAANSTPIELTNITCSIETASDLLNNIGEKKLSDLQTSNVTLTTTQFKTIRRLTQQLLLDNENENSLIATLLIYMFGLFKPQESAPEAPEWLSAFVEKLKNIDYKTTRIGDLYRLSGYSQSVLSTKFKQYYGISIVQFVNQEKLKYSCSLLKKTDMTILDISNELGFSNLSHFNHLFKKTYGISPMQYRKST